MSKTAREHAADLRAEGMACNCDLDNWEPMIRTGHSWVCRIHKAAIDRENAERPPVGPKGPTYGIPPHMRKIQG